MGLSKDNDPLNKENPPSATVAIGGNFRSSMRVTMINKRSSAQLTSGF
jgi:hypothetical protein